MIGVRRHPHQGRADGHDAVTGAGHDAGDCSKKFSGQQKNEDKGQAVDDDQSQVNPRDGLAENRHAQRVGVIRPGQFHVVSQFVGGNTLQNQLPGVGVFAFIPFQRHFEHPQPNAGEE